MRACCSVLRFIFGIFWLVFGINGLFHLFQVPPPPAESAYFMDALARAGYVLPLMYGLQAICGVMLLLGTFVPLALLLLAPIVANIVLYDIALNPGGLAIGIVIAALHAILLWKHKSAYAGILTPQ